MVIPKVYRDVLAGHRGRLLKVAERGGVKELKKLYNEANTELEHKLRGLARASREKFTAQQQSLYLGQIRQGRMVLARKLNSGLGDISKRAQTTALRGLIQDITKLETHFSGAAVELPIEQAARFRGIISGRRESLLRAHAQSVSNYTADVVKKMENQLSLSLVTGKTQAETIDAIMTTADIEWWQAERIARTETAWAFNATHYDGMREAAVEMPDMMMRWVEFVSDDYSPLDDRVDEDSIAMHAQVTTPGGQFVFPSTMPDGSAVPQRVRRLVGRSWSFPPNRPNDRATLAPWRPHWGVPGWQWRGGARVEM